MRNKSKIMLSMAIFFLLLFVGSASAYTYGTQYNMTMTMSCNSYAYYDFDIINQSGSLGSYSYVSPLTDFWWSMSSNCPTQSMYCIHYDNPEHPNYKCLKEITIGEYSNPTFTCANITGDIPYYQEFPFGKFYCALNNEGTAYFKFNLTYYDFNVNKVEIYFYPVNTSTTNWSGTIATNMTVPTNVVKQNQIIPIGITIINNYTDNLTRTFYIGLSIGNNDTGLFCNRDCYVDCDVYNDVSCDYHNVTLHSGQTVTITRYYKFLSTKFNDGQSYDVIYSVNTAPYVSPALSLIYNMYLDYFYIINSWQPIISNQIIIPTGTICRGQNLLFGWNTDINSDTQLSSGYTIDMPYHRSLIENTLNHEINISGIFLQSSGTFYYDLKSCYNSNNPYIYTCSNYTSSLIVSNCEISKPIGEQAGDLFEGLGIGQTAGLYLFSLIISLVLSLAVLFWTKQMDFGIFVFLIFMTIFAFIGWLPFWFLILEIVIAGLFIMTKLRGAISGN